MEDKIAKFTAGLWEACYNLIDGLCGSLGMLFDNSGNYGVMSTANAMIQKIIIDGTTAMQGIGTALALLFFLIALLELTTSERLTLEFFVKFFGKLVIAIALILATPKLVAGIGNFASAFTQEIATIQILDDPDVGTADVTEYFKTLASSIGWIVMIFECVILLLLFLIVFLVLYVVTYVIALTRLVEMGVRGVFLPIAFALISDDGWRGAGGRYIKKYVAIVCQSAVLIMISRIMTALVHATARQSFQNMTHNTDGILESFTDMGTPFGLLIFSLGICIAGVSVMFKSIGIVNDVFGA